MKFALLAVTAIQLGTCVDASPAKDLAEKVEVNGWWEQETSASLENRAIKPGKTFALTQVKNTNYQVRGAPFDLLKTYAKYHTRPPKSLQGAIKTYSKAKGEEAISPRIGPKHGTQKGWVQAFPSFDFDSEYVVPVTIGTPGQRTYLNLDTGSADLWTFSSDTYLPAQRGHTLYKPKNSDTSKLVPGEKWSIEYGDGSGASGILYRDRVEIGETYVKSQAIESAIHVSESIFEDGFSHGILGMGFGRINSVLPTKQKTYMENVQDSLAEPVFTADLQKQRPGTYSFGYINKDQHKGSIYYQKSVSEEFWQVSLNGYRVGPGSFNPYSFTAIVDTGTTLLLAPGPIVKAYYARVKGARLHKRMGVMVFPCESHLPDFIFGMGPYRGTVPGHYMSYGENGDGSCYGGLQTSDDLPFAILGGILLKAQFVVFNIANHTIGFANKETINE
ncbi:aspartic peptidase domain-containing protein [Mariannaea sp. PMI_226]|nr:aspartic peptidase domain-containing protein [Mariannaea sp. PMI_226]